MASITDDLAEEAVRRKPAAGLAPLDMTRPKQPFSSGRPALPTVGTASQAEFNAAREALSKKVPRVPPAGGIAAGIGAPATPPSLPSVSTVSPSQLAPNERAAFQRAAPDAFGQAARAEVQGAAAATRAMGGTNIPPLGNGTMPAAAAPAPAPAAGGGSFRLQPGAAPGRVGQAIGAVANNKLVRVGGAAAGVLAGVNAAARGGTDAIDNGLGLANSAQIGAGTALTAGSLGLGGAVAAPVMAAAGGGYLAGQQISDKMGPQEWIGQGIDRVVKSFGGAGADDSLAARDADRAAGFAARVAPIAAPSGAAAVPAAAKSAPGSAAGKQAGSGIGDGLDDVQKTIGADGVPVYSLRGTAAPASAASTAAPKVEAPPASTYAPSINTDIGQAQRDKRVADLQQGAGAAGALYQQLLADKTPTGKKVAAQFAADYMGQGESEVNARAKLEGDRLGADASVNTSREREANDNARTSAALAADKKTARETIIDDDGNIGSIAEGVFAPVKGVDGKPAKVVKRGKQVDPLERAKLLNEAIAPVIGTRDDYATPEEYTAARTKAIAELQESLTSKKE